MAVSTPEDGVKSLSRVLLIGAGVIARHHAAALEHLANPSGIDLLVSDPSPEARTSFAEQFPNARMFDSAVKMLAEPPGDTDVVIVATPPATHHDLTRQALFSGRHVLCEKPLALSADQATGMLQTAREQGRLLGCCSNRFLGLPTNEHARAVVRSGALGEIYHATFMNRRQRGRSGIEYQPQSTWFLDRRKSGGGTLMDWSPYDLTTLNHILEPVRVDIQGAWMTRPETALVLAPGTVYDTEQHVGAALRYHRADDSTLDITFERAACTHGGERSVVEIEGRDGALTWDWLDWVGTGSVTVTRDKEGVTESETTQPTGPFKDIHLHRRPLVHFARAVLGQPSLAVVNEHAVFNFQCLQAIYRAAESGQPQTVSLDEVG